MRRFFTLLSIGLIAILLSQSGTPRLKSKISATNCGTNIWYGQFLNGQSGLYEHRQLDMSEGYTEAMLYGNDYFLVIYVKDVYGNVVGLSIPVNQTFVFGAKEGELKSDN